MSLFSGLRAETLCEFLPGKAWVQEIKGSYQKGKYDSYLNNVQEAYAKGEVASFEETFKTPEEQAAFLAKLEEIFISKKEISPEINQSAKEREHALLKIADAFPKEAISKVIKESILSSTDQKSSQALKDLILSAVSPDKVQEPAGKNIREFMVKYQIVGLASLRYQRAIPENTDFSDRQKMWVVLLLRQMDDITKSDLIMKDELLNHYSQLLNNFTKLHDLQYLTNLGNGTLQPCNEAEKQVATLMKSFMK